MIRRGGALAALIIVAGCASVPAAPPFTPGYLSTQQIDHLGVATQPATGRFAMGDMADDRRMLAISHAELRPGLAKGHFDCALGSRMAGAETPALIRIFTRLQRDLDAAGRPRDRSAPATAAPCIRDSWISTPDWSGRQAALAAAYADTLARLAPDRATALADTGRAIGHSAVLCGLSTPEDAADGAALGHAVFTAVSTTPDFVADIATARSEIDAVRASSLTSPACAAERRALR